MDDKLTTSTGVDQTTTSQETSSTSTTSEPISNKEYNFEALREAKKSVEKELQKLKTELKAKEEKELAEQGKIKELADLKAKEAEELKKELEAYKVESSIKDSILRSGVDPKFTKFVQLEIKDKVEIKDGEVIGLDKALESIKTEYPDWFSSQTFGNVGSSVTKSSVKNHSFTPEQLADPSFYAANREEILNFAKNNLK